MFDDNGVLKDFYSEDRARTENLASMGATKLEPGSRAGSPRRLRWSTLIRGCWEFEGRTLPVDKVAICDLPKGDHVYGEFEILDINYNVEEV